MSVDPRAEVVVVALRRTLIPPPFAPVYVIAAKAAVAALDAYDQSQQPYTYRTPEQIEADLRERIAQEIGAQYVGADHHEPTFNSGRDAALRLAARIARGNA